MSERSLMESWAREAGSIALAAYRDAAAAPARRKADSTWVTDIDEQVEQLLRQRISSAFPADRVMGEEGGGEGSASGRMWALDPIDGTGSFVRRLPVWGVSIGLLIDGQPAAGCFYMPVCEECYLVGIDGPATMNGEPISAYHDDPLESQAWMAIPSNAHYRYHIRYPGKTRSLGSAAAYICYVARGGAAAGLLGRVNIWDIAGGLAILERAGGVLRGLSGKAINWEPLLRGAPASEPLLAAHAAHFETIRTLIEPR